MPQAIGYFGLGCKHGAKTLFTGGFFWGGWFIVWICSSGVEFEQWKLNNINKRNMSCWFGSAVCDLIICVSNRKPTVFVLGFFLCFVWFWVFLAFQDKHCKVINELHLKLQVWLPCVSPTGASVLWASVDFQDINPGWFSAGAATGRHHLSGRGLVPATLIVI